VFSKATVLLTQANGLVEVFDEVLLGVARIMDDLDISAAWVSSMF